MSQRSTLAAIAVETDLAGCNAGEHVTEDNVSRRSVDRDELVTDTRREGVLEHPIARALGIETHRRRAVLLLDPCI